MSFDGIHGHTDVPPHSDSEEANIPNRSRMITSTAVARNVAQQGTPALTGAPPVPAGSATIWTRWFYQ